MSERGSISQFSDGFESKEDRLNQLSAFNRQMALTEDGFRLLVLPTHLSELVQNSFRRMSCRVGHPMPEEGVDSVVLGTLRPLVYGSSRYGDRDFDALHSHKDMIQLINDWVGAKIVPTVWYGPRVYPRGSRLAMHIDHSNSHRIGVSIPISKKIQGSWPLVFHRDDASFAVEAAIGEAVLYEGSQLPHSRPLGLIGEYSINIFLHYSLSIDDSTPARNVP